MRPCTMLARNSGRLDNPLGPSVTTQPVILQPSSLPQSNVVIHQPTHTQMMLRYTSGRDEQIQLPRQPPLVFWQPEPTTTAKSQPKPERGLTPELPPERK